MTSSRSSSSYSMTNGSRTNSSKVIPGAATAAFPVTFGTKKTPGEAEPRFSLEASQQPRKRRSSGETYP